MHARILAAIDAASDDLIALARRIHATPEVGFQEHRAAAWLTETLERHGFRVERGVAGLPTAFRAEVGTQRHPAVAILAEYDALPEIGHACGHNLISTAAVAAGIGLAALREQLPGTAVVLGTPAEEGGGGKVIMLERGAFQGIDAAMMFHPAGYTLATRPSLASYRLAVRFTGKAAHAAAAPHEGTNALDALIQTFVAIGLLRQQTRDDARIHGIITYGGAAPNIIPDRAEALFTVRAADGGYALEVLHRVIHCAEGARATMPSNPTARSPRSSRGTWRPWAGRRTRRPSATAWAPPTWGTSARSSRPSTRTSRSAPGTWPGTAWSSGRPRSPSGGSPPCWPPPRRWR
ncbi:MAG: amidohydrolase [Armatimonadota bacterium]|nr:amidohydrolase [Armatimonadota bacterium]